MNAQRVKIFHIADCDAIVITVAHNLIFHLFPALQRFFHQNLGRIGKSTRCQFQQFLLIGTKTGTQTAQRVSRPHNQGITQLISRCHRFVHIAGSDAPRCLYPDFLQLAGKYFPVLRINDSLHRSAQHLHVVFFKNAFPVQLHPAVQGSLPAKRKQNAIRAFLLDYLFHILRRHRQIINLIRHSFGSLYRRDIRINQHTVFAFLAYRLQRLRTGIVELSSLTYFQRA